MSNIDYFIFVYSFCRICHFNSICLFILHTKEFSCARRYLLFYVETFQQKRYLVTVLVPIGVGIVGAALIVCTILTLRKVARQRSLQVPFDDAEVERSITPSVSSVSTFFCN